MSKFKGLEHYNGTKGGSGVYQTIINHMPPHLVYGELFLGRGEILRKKKPAQINWGIDVDWLVTDVWKKNKIKPHIQIANACSLFLISKISAHLKGNRQYGSQPRYFCDLANSINVLLYLDPPYPKGSRKSDRDLYKYEMTDAQHESMLKDICDLRQVKIMVSTYPNKLYLKYLTKKRGWHYTDFYAQTRSGGSTERLYYNFPKPTELHEYTFVGKNFRERERIKNKIRRRVNSLLRLREKNPVEFNAVMHGIETRVRNDKNKGAISKKPHHRK